MLEIMKNELTYTEKIKDILERTLVLSDDKTEYLLWYAGLKGFDNGDIIIVKKIVELVNDDFSLISSEVSDLIEMVKLKY